MGQRNSSDSNISSAKDKAFSRKVVETELQTRVLGPKRLNNLTYNEIIGRALPFSLMHCASQGTLMGN
jgi:hypothetical protein